MFTKLTQLAIRAFWTLRQPLTLVPEISNSSVSDLFIWKSSFEWETFFELIDATSLFGDVIENQHVTILFLDKNGNFLFEKQIDLVAHSRQTINISSMIGRSYGELGSFVVFYAVTPKEIKKNGSFLAERGYISYRFRDAPLRSYIHGNLDAVAQGKRGLEFLGGLSFFRREYNLQYELEANIFYEMIIVNPSRMKQRFSCRLISSISCKVVFSQEINLGPGEVGVVPIFVDGSETGRLVIKSFLVMARPLVFRLQNNKMDIFHG
jgi:hypothetical protein